MEFVKSDTHFYNYDENDHEDKNEDSSEYGPDNFILSSRFIKNLVAEPKSLIVDGERPNPYYCYDFADNLIRFAKLFPLWTTVMTRNKFSVATSSYSEEYIRKVKQFILKGKSAIRVDKILVQHMRLLTGTTKILHALHQNENDILPRNQKKRKLLKGEITDGVNKTTKVKMKNEVDIGIDNDTTNAGNQYSEENSKPFKIAQNIRTLYTQEPEENRDLNIYLNEKETWKGKNRDRKERGKYVRSCPDIQQRHERPKSVTSTVPLLKNGLLLAPVKLKNKNILVRNTCPIDSISQSMLVANRD
ncbi:unnamed protein product [Euphydryas editha]|uniref:Uncharacterized protein n=1 Tax=Euphydryas editha TaxID=104508 RepID=A0AAU9URK3_EUPED|nr:unnamed protein product [Euphydryas editha]